MKKVRFGIVGLGNMGKLHAKWIVEDSSRDFCVTAVSDTDETIARSFGKNLDVAYFVDPNEMYESGLCDAVIIAVPHYLHPTLAIQAARKGLHILCEKPLASTIGPARAMILECKKNKVACGVMLQHRTRSIMKKMKQLVEKGYVGEVFRVSMICSNWYRTQAYYDSGSWRGTWNGEGGGIMLNQAPHNLDLFQWIGGMPQRVVAVLGTRLHKIEVENTANVICGYGKGKTGYIYATTAEAPGMDQLMICGDRGTLIAENDQLRMCKLKTPISKHIKTCKDGFTAPEGTWKKVNCGKKVGGEHIEVTRAFVKHLIKEKPLVASDEDAIKELELSNAIYLAGFKGKPVSLPVNAGEMDRLMTKLVREHTPGRSENLWRKSYRELRKLLKS